jgi:hypothetical protein
MKIYLDMCCYNRPFDEKDQVKTEMESFAKLHIQNRICEGEYELVWSYILDLENKFNPYEDKRNSIGKWKDVAKVFVKYEQNIVNIANRLGNLGIKENDALHIACAINSNCSYLQQIIN